MLSIDLTSTNSPGCRFRDSAGVVLLLPRAYAPRNTRRILQNNHVPMRCAISRALQLPARISAKHLANRSHRDNGLAAFHNSLAWQKYVFGPVVVLRRARSWSPPPKLTLDWTAASST